MPACNNTINSACYLFMVQSLTMFLYKWRYVLFSVFLLGELAGWLVALLPAGIFFDTVPDFVFTIFMVVVLCSPLVCFLYWAGLGHKYGRTAWGKADALAFAVSVVAFLPKAIFIITTLIAIYEEES